jgi:predicted transcriptional regulator
MVEELRYAIERAQQQPEEQQRHIAQAMVDELEDQEWEFSSALRAALAEAHAEFAAGEVMDYEDYAQQRQRLR